MLKSPAIRTYSESIKYIKDNKISNILLSFTLLVLAYGFVTNKTTVIVKPPMMNQTIEYTAGQANAALKIAWGDWVASLTGNINPNSEPFIKSELKKIMEPQIEAEFFSGLNAHVETLKLKESEQIFSVLEADYIPKADIVWVYGEKEEISKRKGRGKPVPWTYEIKVRIVDGSPLVYGFAQYQGEPDIQGMITNFNHTQQKQSDQLDQQVNKDNVE
ncbi:TraE/TraK family type IV conjugative transfer system protein [Pseudoalteromonas sp. T1lg23B]|uniref:TraE/TraK family type IV conjugative transfer system protein n=1 Tax=Pseudoalteromonas sp. T1lg23B TaxID=2077097 RepID=UPI001319BB79|nr:TraE/TraK family type IV conjugative transfer system protein [Pseudoalteromonas sp. T1lg23B]